MGNMRFKVGDRVRIKSLDWYNENKDKDGFVDFSTSVFVPGMSQFCGKIVTIEDVFDEDDDVVYCMEEIDYDWTDEMIEGLVEEEFEVDLIPKFGEYSDNEPLDIPTMTSEFVKEHGLPCPDGYIFKDENGNVINATKIVLEKKKKEYPKTYEECYKIVGVKLSDCYIQGYKSPLLEDLQELLICRDAYWKIAGEEMGLGKPWEPDWKDDTTHKFIIHTIKDKIHCGVSLLKNHLLAFPTEEMRDAFYESFKELIESTKELL